MRAPNLLLVIVDDLRADRVGYAGLTRARTPVLDDLAARGLVYTDCLSTCGWTLPACASIVTGLLPSEHGLIHHDRRFEAPKLPSFLPHAYTSLGIGNNGNLVPDTIDRETLDGLGFERRPEVWKHFGWQEGFDEYLWFHKQVRDRPFDEFRAWIEGRDGPWFAMLHTNVVHDYDADEPAYVDVEDLLGRPVGEPLRRFRDGPWVWKDRPEGYDDDRLAEELLAKYDGGIADFDRRLGEVLTEVDRRETWICVVSDHGEAFDGASDRVHHCGRLHHDLLHVPLVLVAPEGHPAAARAGERVTFPASVLDVAPTLVALAGGDPSSLPGENLLDLPRSRTLRAEDLGYLYLPPGAPAERLRRYDYRTHELASAGSVTDGVKRIDVRLGRQSWQEEYDLVRDPLERINRAPLPHGPLRRPRKEEGALGGRLRDWSADSDEAQLLKFARSYRSLRSWIGRRRKLPPTERVVPFERIEGAEPITFVVAVDDPQELRRHLHLSPCFANPVHQFLLVENGGNRAYTSISALYEDALADALHDLVFCVHQDVLFPPDFEQRLFRSLAELERIDPDWGVIGAAGRAPGDRVDGELPRNIGHWSDPHKYHRPRVDLPAPVQILDELWLGFRRSSGLRFDRELHGFHCYGADLCLTARAAGRRSYVLDAPVIHKLLRPDGSLIERSEQSHKIEGRSTRAFRDDFRRSAAYVASKWERYLPFHSTCHSYERVMP